MHGSAPKSIAGMDPTDFLARGIEEGEPALVIATAPHQASLRKAFVDNGHDIARITFVDAEAMLATFMVDGEPSWEAFQANVGDALRTAAKGSTRRVRAHTEMVDLLRRSGNPTAAIRVE